MSDDAIDKLFFLALGWLLGLLAPIIVDAIRRRRENALGRAAIYAELRDVAHKLALAGHHVRSRNGTVDRLHLEWLKRHLETHAGLVDTSNVLQMIRLQLSWPDEQLLAYVQAEAAKSHKAIELQKYLTPLLDSRVSAMWSFDTAVQRHLLDLRANMEMLNDMVDRARKYFDMTFAKLENDNYSIVVANLEQCYALYAERAKRIVDQVAELNHSHWWNQLSRTSANRKIPPT